MVQEGKEPSDRILNQSSVKEMLLLKVKQHKRLQYSSTVSFILSYLLCDEHISPCSSFMVNKV